MHAAGVSNFIVYEHTSGSSTERILGASAQLSVTVSERLGPFQQAMLRLIVQRLTPQREIYLPGEVCVRRRKTLAPPTTTTAHG